jgi:hypothetical protein
MHNIPVIEDNDEHHFDFGVHVECFQLHKAVARKISIVMAALNFWDHNYRPCCMI